MRLATTVNLTVIALLITAVASQSYTNHTVGGPSGWFFNSATNTTSTDYSKWAAAQVFNLGDYLIFNTTTNQTVIHTYNATTYRNCDSEDALDTDTVVYSGGNEIDKELTFAIPLTIEGANYFFSDADDGEQCEQGMGFEINVKHGLGLPPSLNQPPPPPYTAPPPSDLGKLPPPVDTNQGQEFYNGGRENYKGRGGGGVVSFGLLVVAYGVLLLG